MKKCTLCKIEKENVCFSLQKKSKDRLSYYCRECRSIYYKKWHKKTYFKRRKRIMEMAKIRYQKNKVEYLKKKKEQHKKIRQIVLRRYGNKCKCCGEEIKEFLAIDHINGGGAKHRKFSGIKNIYIFLFKKEILSKEYQVLCHNCNLAKGFYGGCPHNTLCHR